MASRKPLVLNAGQPEQLQAGDTLAIEVENVVALINANTSLYIATNGNDSTGDGSSGTPWLTLEKVQSYLSNKLIATDKTVTVIIENGYFDSNAAYAWNHPSSDRILIQGQNTYDKTLSSVQSSGGDPGAKWFILNLNNVTNIAANDYVLIPYNVTGGTNPEYLCGPWKVGSVDVGNNRITISTTVGATVPSGNVTGTVTILKTVLRKTTTANGFTVSPRNVLRIQNLIIEGQYTGGNAGLSMETGSAIVPYRIGIRDFYCGVASYSTNVQFTDSSIACYDGLDTYCSTIDLRRSCIVASNAGLYCYSSVLLALFSSSEAAIVIGTIIRVGEPETPTSGASTFNVTNDSGDTVYKCTPVQRNYAGTGFILFDADTFLGLVADDSIDNGYEGAIQNSGVLTATDLEWDAVTGESGGLTPGAVYYCPWAGGNLVQTLTGVRVGFALNSEQMLLIPRDTNDIFCEFCSISDTFSSGYTSQIGENGGIVGFYGTSPIAKPEVTGSRGSNAALTSLLTALANLGIITNSSS